VGGVRCWPQDGGQGTGPAEYRTGKAAGGLARISFGICAVSTFPQNRGFPSAITTSLAGLLNGTVKIQSGQVLLTRG